MTARASCRKTGNIYFGAIVIECLHEIYLNTLHFYRYDDNDDGDDDFFGILREFSKWNSAHSQHLIEMWTEETLALYMFWGHFSTSFSNICAKKANTKIKYANKDNVRFCFSFASIGLFNQVTWAWTPMKKSPLFSCLNWNFEQCDQIYNRPEISMNSSQILRVMILSWPNSSNLLMKKN